MARKKGAISLDTMMKAVVQNYQIPTRRDIEKLLARIDRLEKEVKNSMALRSRVYGGGKLRAGGRLGASATDAVLSILKGSKTGMGIKDIQTRTGFDDKKLRNIIFRLNKLGKIERKTRGRYTAV